MNKETLPEELPDCDFVPCNRMMMGKSRAVECCPYVKAWQNSKTQLTAMTAERDEARRKQERAESRLDAARDNAENFKDELSEAVDAKEAAEKRNGQLASDWAKCDTKLRLRIAELEKTSYLPMIPDGSECFASEKCEYCQFIVQDARANGQFNCAAIKNHPYMGHESSEHIYKHPDCPKPAPQEETE